MKHLSGLDASFLHLETPEMPMHVGALHLLDLPGGSADFLDTVKCHIADRMHLAPVFFTKLAFMPLDLANPVWVDDDDLDLDYHIRQVSLPKPGSQAQLEASVARLHAGLLDRSRPLWEFFLITGLQSGQVGFFTKIHHAALDGQGAMVLAKALLDVTPEPRWVPPPPPHERAPYQPAVSRLLKAALVDTLSQSARLVRGLPTGLRVAASMLGRNEDGERRASWPSMAPRTPLNRSITNQRVFAALTIELQEALAVSKAFGCTLNDVVLAIVSGALRRYLDEHDALPDAPLVAAVPVSLRADGDTEINNQVSMMLMKIGSDEADPAERLRAVAAASARMKKTVANVKSVLPTEFPSLGVPWMMGTLVSLYGRARLADKLPPVANVVVSNVPGPRMPLYLAGARITANFPASIVTHGLGLNVTVQSYGGALDVGIVACRRVMPDIALFAACMRAAHEELVAAAGALAAPAPAKPKRAPRKAAAPAAESLKPVKPKAPRKPRKKAEA
jgi:diacylglycerol O-acyltransferase